MKTLLITAASVSLVAGALATTAQAQQGQQFQQGQQVYPKTYVGGDAMFWDLDPDNGSSANSVGLRLNGGAQFNDYFGLEAHVGTGGSDGDVELDYLVGAYAKGIAPISHDFRLYGLAGFTEVDYDVDRESDFSYGAGAEFDVADNLAVGVDYMRYLDKSDYSFDAASVGVRYRF